MTEYVDHEQAVAKEQTDPSRRIKSIAFGSGARTKQRAWNLALDYADAGTFSS